VTNVLEGMMSDIKSLLKRVSHLEARRIPTWVYLAAPLTSTAWDGDARSTTAKTLIDLSSVFGAPAGIKAILVRLYGRDSSSYTDGSAWVGFAPDNTAFQLAIAIRPAGIVNDNYTEGQGIVPCNASGDIYYQCAATGASTLDVWLEIWGYLI
jgi:hypothetical protein